MNAPQVTLQSITGVDVELRIAGPGSRSYAFVIDWHIRLLLALAWLFGAAYLLFGSLVSFMYDGVDPRSSFYFVVIAPPLAIYFLYHPVLEVAMHGRTPGKRMAGVRIVTRNGDIPGPGALLLRNVFRLIDSLPVAYLVGLATVIFTAQHVRIGDLAAGTLLIMDGTADDGSLASLERASKSRLDPQAADLVQELLDRWTSLQPHTRLQLARSLMARIDRAASADELQAQSEAELRARLTTLLEGAHER